MESVSPQIVFNLFGVPIYDSVVSTWIMMAIIIGAIALARWRFPSALEKLIAFLGNMIAEVMDRPAEPYLPFLGALAIFITIANILSILPTIPLPGNKMLPIVAPTRDINTPAALAATVFVAVHVYAIREKGLWRHLKAMASPLGLVILMLPLEIVGQLSRTLALALRLFGNIVSSEMIVNVIFQMVPPIAPLPMILLGLFTGVLQAYVFTVLAAVFIALAVREND
ncbi:MAG: F0F1 ATP synthase subunit A [Anaerolineae bacterium]|jgi:F-type H+-transporting ATPase subunit a|nr:F0F1 ATP synthase subunit A [Anaerolineae bacterium]